MRTTPARFLIARIFSKYGNSLSAMSKEEAMEELKEMSGEDYGDDEGKWYAWVEEHEARILKGADD